MPLTRHGTKRPRAPLLQLNMDRRCGMCRIGGRKRSGVARRHGSNLEIPPLLRWRSNSCEGEQCLVGSLTGVVTSERVTEVSQGPLMPDGNRQGSAKVGR